MPVSRTEKRTNAWPSWFSARLTAMLTSPFDVKRIAFASRLTRIWRTRVTSPVKPSGTSGAMVQKRSMPFSPHWIATQSIASSTTMGRSNGWSSSSSLPDSILEKSRISLMIVSSVSALERMVCA